MSNPENTSNLTPELQGINNLTEGNAKQAALMMAEFSDIKAMLNVILALQKFALTQSGIPQADVENQVQSLFERFQKDAQHFAGERMASANSVKFRNLESSE